MAWIAIGEPLIEIDRVAPARVYLGIERAVCNDAPRCWIDDTPENTQHCGQATWNRVSRSPALAPVIGPASGMIRWDGQCWLLEEAHQRVIEAAAASWEARHGIWSPRRADCIIESDEMAGFYVFWMRYWISWARTHCMRPAMRIAD